MAPADNQITSERLLERRLDYAWKYFDSASQKRMQFINFFVLMVGILANAYVLALKEHLFAVAVGVCLFGSLSAVTFIFLDRRMLVFVNRALDVLETLERDHLFPNGFLRHGPNGTEGGQLGLARTEPDMAATGKTNAQTGAVLTKVWFWIRVVVEGVAAAGFALGALYAILKWCGIITW